MKIAQVVCVFPPYRGGIGNSVYNLARSLTNLGHHVTVFTPDYKNYHEENQLNDLPKETINIRRLKACLIIGNGAWLPQLFFKLKDFDIIHFHYPFYGAVKAVLFKKFIFRKKMKLVLHYHMDSRAKGLKGFIFFLYKIIFLPILIRLAKVITCASLDYIKHSDLREYYRAYPDKFRQISFGVNLDQFVIYHDDLNKNRDYNSLLFVGGLDKAHYFKGLENLIKALAEIIKIPQYSSTILNVVGSGDLLPYYKRRAVNLGLGQAVTFQENVDNSKLVSFYNYCDCLVLPSINQGEAFGLVLLEAMACSKPIITSNLPGVRSVFKNGREGLLVKPDCVSDLVKKIIFIFKDKKRAELMGQAGRRLVEKKYTWDKVGKKLHSIYHYAVYT